MPIYDPQPSEECHNTVDDVFHYTSGELALPRVSTPRC
jgi:hypothetical protein